MPLTHGTRLGSYEIVAKLGEGGMGEVYRAPDPRLGREVAIKVLPIEVAQDASRLARFAQEARAAATLNHPHILSVYDVATAGEMPFLVSELLEGQTLAERLASGRLSVRRATELAQQVAHALAAAHARHRAPGPQARQHLRDDRGPRQAAGLRAGGRRDRGARCRLRHHYRWRPAGDGRGSDPGHRGLHGTGTGAGPGR